MKRIARILGVLVGFVALLVGGAFLLIESGEVVVLRTEPDQDHRFLARLWVVDHDGAPWLGTGNPATTGWVPWLREHPRFELERAGATECREAVFVDDLDVHSKLSSISRSKYRIPWYGSQFLKMISGARRDAGESVWIRLEPCVDG